MHKADHGRETLGKFMRELFGQTIPTAAQAKGATQILERTDRMYAS